MLLNKTSLLEYELPRLVPLTDNLYGGAFYLMKLLPARFMLDRAEETGDLKPGGHICETTSGTFGLALAMLSAVRGCKLTLVSDPAIDEALHRRLRDLGAEVSIVETPYKQGGFQKARLDRLKNLLKIHPDSFCPQQYENRNNQLS